jgi:hypothetical protein
MNHPFERLEMHCMSRLVICLAALICLMSTSGIRAHELEENRASLVLRNERQINVALYLNLAALSQRILAPKQAWLPFVSHLAAMSDEDFHTQWVKVQNSVEAGIDIQTTAGRSLRMHVWQWPEEKAVQKYFRELTMHSVVTPDAHLHETPFEIRFQTQSHMPVIAVNLKVSAALRPITLVATQPRQTRIDLDMEQATVRF